MTSKERPRSSAAALQWLEICPWCIRGVRIWPTQLALCRGQRSNPQIEEGNTVKSAKGVRPTPPSKAKEFTFRALAIMLPFVVLLLLEFGFRLFPMEARDKYINLTPFSLFTRETIDGVDSFVITSRFGYNQRTAFPVKKPDGGIRIFLLGGSAIAGWPHPPAETFASYLQQAIQRAYPGRSVEVINAAGHGFASYRARRVFDEIIKLDPTAIIIWSGNNEFLESREYDTGATGLLDALSDRSQLVSRIQALVSPAPTKLPGDDLRDVAGFFWAKVKQEALKLRSDPGLLSRVQEHYADSIRYMVTEATQRNIPVILFTVPSNLRDWLPTVSHNGLKGARLKEWTRLIERAQKALLEQDPQAGISALNQAIEMEPEHAESYFWLGRLYEAAGQKEQALENYRLAKDLDYNPFRALSSFNQSVRQIAAETDGVVLLDLERILDRESDQAAPGFDLFLDYVHPTTRTNLVITEKAFGLLMDRELLGPRSTNSAASEPITAGTSYDETRDFSIQRRLFYLFALNHQYEAGYHQALRLHGLKTGGPAAKDCEELTPDLPRLVRQGCSAFRQQLAVHRLKILGQPADTEQADAELHAFYHRYAPSYAAMKRSAKRSLRQKR